MREYQISHRLWNTGAANGRLKKWNLRPALDATDTSRFSLSSCFSSYFICFERKGVRRSPFLKRV